MWVKIWFLTRGEGGLANFWFFWQGGEGGKAIFKFLADKGGWGGLDPPCFCWHNMWTAPQGWTKKTRPHETLTTAGLKFYKEQSNFFLTTSVYFFNKNRVFHGCLKKKKNYFAEKNVNVIGKMFYYFFLTIHDFF